jgi:antitoxin component YwqK of YwqJK toxin-antitoxin module
MRPAGFALFVALTAPACTTGMRRLESLPACPSGSEMSETEGRNGLGCYRDGKPHGPFVFFYDDGVVRARAAFDHGALNGRFTEYWENGVERFTVLVKDGKFEGPLVNHFPDGKIDRIATYQNDILDGPYEQRRADGSMQMKGQYLDGEQTGTWTYWRKPGAKPERYEFSRGKVLVPLFEMKRLPDP